MKVNSVKIIEIRGKMKNKSGWRKKGHEALIPLTKAHPLQTLGSVIIMRLLF